MNKPYNTFDLPTKHLEGLDYIPPKARDPQEIARRKSLPNGTLLLEMQQRGLAISRDTMKGLEDPEDVAFASQLLAESALNASWHQFVKGKLLMRRPIAIPKLADDETQWRMTPEELYKLMQGDIKSTAVQALRVVNAKKERRLKQEKTIHLGRRMGNTALILACINLGDEVEHLSAFDAQLLARNRSLSVMESARERAAEIGVNPSLAQLGDADSPLSVYWRRHAPNGAFDAYMEALETTQR